MIVAGAAVLRQNLSALAQNASAGTCGQTNVSNETAGTPDFREMLFARFLGSCTGRIVSWEVCYFGPTNPLEDEPYYEVVYAVYRIRRSNGSEGILHYVKVSDTFSTKLRKIVDDGGRGSSEGGIREDEDDKRAGEDEIVCGSMLSGNTVTYSPLHEGFHCNSYKMINTGCSPVIQAKDIIGAYVKNRNGTMTDIVGVVNTSKHSLNTDNCGADGFPSEVQSDQLSHLNSTRLHLYVKTGECSS